jgi:CHASE2 domain-containing sensor protein
VELDIVIARLRRLGSGLAGKIPRRAARYWLTALAVFVTALWTAPFIDGRLELTRERSWLFQQLSHATTNPTQPRNVKLLLIGDDEFWDGALHHRTPIDKSYVAQLVRRLDEAEASVIALDFDVRLASPGRAVPPGDYVAVDSYEPYRIETDALIRAIDDVAQRRKIVLSKTILGPTGGPFTLGADICQPYGICVHLGADGQWVNPGTPEFPLTQVAQRNLSCGYIALMPDKRQVPPPAQVEGEARRLDSFPLAIVRARDPAAAPAFASRPYYASYISEDLAMNPRITVSAHDLLADQLKARSVLQGWPVIVGEAWHQRAKGSGGLVDVHETPIGPVVGALVHENMAEAMLSNRIYPGLNGHGLLFMEALVGVLAALVFAAFTALWMRVLVVVASMALLFFIQWLTLQLFGVFFDAFIPVLGLGLHAIIDRMIGH